LSDYTFLMVSISSIANTILIGHMLDIKITTILLL
jgi:hypothetical protein